MALWSVAWPWGEAPQCGGGWAAPTWSGLMDTRSGPGRGPGSWERAAVGLAGPGARVG